MVVSRCHQAGVEVEGVGTDAYYICLRCGRPAETYVSFLFPNNHKEMEDAEI